MRDDIWYREELVALRDLVHAHVQSGAAALDVHQQAALGHLYAKLCSAIETAPSGRTP